MPIVRRLIIPVVIVALIACSQEPQQNPEANFRFRLSDGATAVVRTDTVHDATSVGLPSGMKVASFTVDHGFVATGDHPALHIVLSNPADGTRIGTVTPDGPGTATTPVPDSAAGVVLIEVPLATNEPFSGFFIAYPADQSAPRVSAAGIGNRSARFERSDGVTHFGSEMNIDRFDQQSARSVEISVDSALAVRLQDRHWTVAVRFEPRDEEAAQPEFTTGRIAFEAYDGSARRSIDLVLTPGNRELFFPRGIVGFVPGTVSIEVDPGMRIEMIEVRPDGLVGTDTRYPAIPADLGAINGFDQRMWRHPRYELYRWNAMDNVLIFDFADFDIQRDMFGRLGFFVAVVGEAGRIFPEEHYEGRHAYNAHDYRPEDLVRFYNTAAETGIVLNEWEKFLRDLLVDYDIIRSSAIGFSEGEGAVLSYARPIWGPLRARLLRHEAAHGLFYVSPVFRDGAFVLWDQMSELEQEYWRLFLGNKGRMDGREGYDGYDVDRLYLLVNEMQAHVLQLTTAEVNPYFRDHYSRRIREVRPESASVVERLLAAEPDVFVNTRRNLEQLLEEATGIRGGRMMAVTPRDIEPVTR